VGKIIIFNILVAIENNYFSGTENQNTLFFCFGQARFLIQILVCFKYFWVAYKSKKEKTSV